MAANSVDLTGRAGRDGELKYTQDGLATLSFSLAHQPRGDNPTVAWMNVMVFGEEAERTQVSKGDYLFVHGRLAGREWDAADGTKQRRTDIIADLVHVFPKRDQPANDYQPPRGQHPAQRTARYERASSRNQ